MAVGKSGEEADRDKLKISFGGHVVAEKGMRAAKYNEATATKAVSGREVEIAVDLGLGKGAARVWTPAISRTAISTSMGPIGGKGGRK